MIEKNLENKILEKIKTEHLKPKSVWYFIAKDYSLWGLVALSVLLAALSIAPIIFIIQNLEIGYIKHITNNSYLFILYILPYPWIILCIVTTYFAKKAWEKTKHGYKFDGKNVLALSLLTSLALGLILNLWNVGRQMDERIQGKSFGYYKSVQERKEENWFNPEQGRLIGVIVNISTSSFILFNQKNDFTEEVYFDENLPGGEYIDLDNKLRIIGYNDNNTRFIACSIFPDNLIPPRERAGFRAEMKDKIVERFTTHPECKEIFEKGRAYFQPSFNPQPGQTGLK